MVLSEDNSIEDRSALAANRSDHRHRIVIVGSGFGGLGAVTGLAGAPVIVTLIDQRNFHLFQPLLYQVATASLATSEIAWPIRYLVRGRHEVTTMLATVVGVDARARHVLINDGRALPYDTLILATGARHAYFGHDEWEAFAPGLKTLEDATTVRRRILLASAVAASDVCSADWQRGPAIVKTASIRRAAKCSVGAASPASASNFPSGALCAHQ
jgi:NADH dehydrogenase FAD-containing subunit